MTAKQRQAILEESLLPIAEPVALVQSRVPERELELLKAHAVRIPELIRHAVHQAFLQLKDVPPPAKAPAAKRRKSRKPKS